MAWPSLTLTISNPNRMLHLPKRRVHKSSPLSSIDANEGNIASCSGLSTLLREREVVVTANSVSMAVAVARQNERCLLTNEGGN